ncbi:MAG: glycine--tRNA ligase subunit beta, partial [Caldilineaceae bacterium]|nr:glycine--tRNA ligase subunit beta [Caldilineaceae bacterium]
RSATGFPEEPADLLFEIGLEEMPAAAVPSGIAQLEALLAEKLATARLAHGAVEVSGTVRRLVAKVRDLAPAQASQTTERRGPSVKIAFDSDGAPTRAAVGFARGQGLSVSRLEVRGEHVYAARTEAGQRAGEVLPDILGAVLDGFGWGRAMRWDGSGKEFIRPVRWLLALLGDSPVPFTWGELNAATETRVPRWQELGDAATPGAVRMEPA